MVLERKKWTKKFLVRLPKDAKPKDFLSNQTETELIKIAFEEIYGIDMDIQDIIRADIQKFKR